MDQKLSTIENWKNLLESKISRFLNFWPYFEILNFSLSKNHLAFLAIQRHDIELTNIKLSDKNFVFQGGAQAPEGELILLLFWNFAIFGAECWVSKKVQKFFVCGNKYHSLTRKIGLMLIL